jgi:predicted DNA binding CopG/RHH family protein
MADQTNGIGTQSAIDRLETQQNEYLDQQQKLNDQIVDTGVQKMQSQVDFEKQQVSVRVPTIRRRARLHQDVYEAVPEIEKSRNVATPSKWVVSI